MSASPGPARPSRIGWALGFGLSVLLALGLRLLGFEFVFLEDTVVFPPADAQYHLRRALYSFIHFPAVLLYDPYINFPGGAPIPWPPLFDFAIAGSARLLADGPGDLHGFEVVAAWASPVCAILSLIPVYASGVLLHSRRAGIGAALFLACLPIHITYSRVGNADHHAAVAMIGAFLLWASLGLVATDARSRSQKRFALLLALARLAMLLTWHGSLLYLVLADGLLLLAGILMGRRSLLALQGGTAVLSLGILLPIVWLSPEPLGGNYSSIALSRLHLLFLFAVALLDGLLFFWLRVHPERGPARRLAVLFAASLSLLGLAALLPQVREGLLLALGFMTLKDEVGAVTGEQSPLFETATRSALRPALLSWGLFAYAIPFAPAAALLAVLGSDRSPRLRGAGMLLFGWVFVMAFLSLGQRRYGNDFAASASLVFALAATFCCDCLAARIRLPALRSAATGGLILLLLLAAQWPVLRRIHWPRAEASLAALAPQAAPRRDVESSVAVTLTRFMHDVRRATPETAFYLDGKGEPAYGVIAQANFGHALQYGARRATATDPFWWYIGRENWDRSHAFLRATREDEALKWARSLGGRFVLTSSGAASGSVMEQLHRHDGRALAGRAPLQHFRLVQETDAGSWALGEIFRPSGGAGIAYKLFEIVAGASLRIETEPGLAAEISLALQTPPGRRLFYRIVARADDDGLIRVRLPYASPAPAADPDPQAAVPGPRTRSLGPYRIRLADREEELWLGEEAVLSGEEIELSLPIRKTLIPSPSIPSERMGEAARIQ